jgi:Matrixin
MRRLLPLLASSLAALAATGSASAAELPASGFLVFKDMLRGKAVVEVRDDSTGRVVARLGRPHRQAQASACGDPHYRHFARWRGTPTYYVNAASVPSYLDQTLARSELVRAQRAWEGRMTTDCTSSLRSGFDARDGGNTSLEPTTVTRLEVDGVNVVGWVSLAGTVCEGALACVVADFSRGRISEADLAFESDLTRYGFQDFWTTDRTTWTDATGGEFAISDVGTHEFGHFAGLDHVGKSPKLTMFPFIHDGDDTLGLGDMRGIVALYH